MAILHRLPTKKRPYKYLAIAYRSLLRLISGNREFDLKTLLRILLATVAIHGAAYAKNDKVERGPTPDWVNPIELLPVPSDSSGLVFVRGQDVVVHLDEKGQITYTGYRAKLLHPNALAAGNLAISWNPAAGSPLLHSIKVFRDGQVIDVSKTTAFEILRREDQLEVAMLDGALTAVARVADLRVGDELEFSYSVRHNDPTLGNVDSGLLFLAGTTSPGRYRLALNWTADQQPQVKMTDDMKAVAQPSEQSLNSVSTTQKTSPRRKMRRRVTTGRA